MEQTLAEFFRSYAEKPWEPGKVDCCLMLAAWAIWLGHPDPVARWRGTYRDEEGFRAIIERAGSVTALIGQVAAEIGAKPLQRPACGAIGVIGSVAHIHRQFGAIHDGSHWKVRFKNGVGPMVAAPLKIWMI